MRRLLQLSCAFGLGAAVAFTFQNRSGERKRQDSLPPCDQIRVIQHPAEGPTISNYRIVRWTSPKSPATGQGGAEGGISVELWQDGQFFATLIGEPIK